MADSLLDLVSRLVINDLVLELLVHLVVGCAIVDIDVVLGIAHLPSLRYLAALVVLGLFWR